MDVAYKINKLCIMVQVHHGTSMGLHFQYSGGGSLKTRGSRLASALCQVRKCPVLYEIMSQKP